MRTSLLLLALLLLVVPVLTAQGSRPIAPGMTTDEVRAALGAPAVVREADGWTYFFYTNRCLPRCGTDDTVFFHDGRVVSAMLHAPSRLYSGPAAAPALGRESAEPAARTDAEVTRIRVRSAVPAEAPAANLGVISGRMRAATPVAGPDAPHPRGEIVSVDTVYVPDSAPGQTEPGTSGRAETGPGERSDAGTRTSEPVIAPNTIRRPPPR